MAGAELELQENTVVEDEGVKESTSKEEGEKTADKQVENDEDEESTYEAEENDDSDHTQVPEDDEHREVVDEAIIQDAPATDAGKEGQVDDKEENDQENAAVEETINLEEETKAATVIQSNFRGHKERKRLQEEGKIPAKQRKDKIPTEEENVPEVQTPAEETEKESVEEAEASASDAKTEDPDETKAAVVIQSNFRGHKERKRLEEEGKIPKKRKKEKEVTPEPPKEDGQVTQTEESVQDVSSENLEGMDEEKAATVLQSNFRGQRDRKKVKAEREAQKKATEEAVIPDDAEDESEVEAEEKALDVTDVVIERKEETDAEKQRLEEEQAAVKIQSNFRGYKERKNLQANKQSSQKEAELLQSFSKEVTAFFFIITNHLSVLLLLPLIEYIASISLQQITKASQDFVALQQKLNEIIQAHHSNPENNGMFVKGKAINGYALPNHQSSKISSVKISQQ